MKVTCLSKGSGFHFPPCHILDVSGFRILLDCPLDLSALTIFSPVSPSPKMEEEEQTYDFAVNNCLDMRKRQKILKSLICAQPWYKTPNNLHLWDPSSIDLVLISSTMGMLALPFLTQTKGFSAKIYATEATTRLGQLMMEDLVLMHNEFQHFYGSDSGSPQWMSWEELELLSPALRQVALGKDGTELGGWMPLYRSTDVEDCVKKVQTLKYAEEAWYNGTLLIKAFSSGLEIGSCNWTINSPKRNVAYISGSKFHPVHAMEFDYHALRGNDLILYSDFSSEGVLTNDEHYNNFPASTTYNSSTPRDCSTDNDDRILKECLLRNDESLEEREKVAFICSCAVDSVKAGGSVIIPLNQLGIVLQLLEQIPVYLESSAMKVPIYVISSVAAELLAFTNIIPEWLCKERQEKLFSGEPLFSHPELMKGEKLYVFPDVNSPELLTSWQEPCIIFSPHWSLRLGPVVHLLRRWRGDENSLLVLEDGLDTDMALLPFKPLAMKVLQCSFLSGIRLQKTQPLLEILRPKVVLFPEDLREQINISSSHSFPVLYYAENETLDVPKSRGNVDLEIASNLATQLSWRKLDHDDDMDIARLGGQLFIDGGKHQVLSGNKVSDKPLLHWGFPDVEKLLAALSKMGVKGSVEECMSDDAESGSDGIVHIHEPSKALIEVRATRTVISARDERLASLIFEAIGTLTDGI
ncbi:INTEGRATOR COMPLEX SUBUNIT 9 [Salix viminalis]|uniref:INTEGRATOR COMPLEX SUBUNIT 9 n=1 Tax=Salix viminalis TaxID=40686 RepID=A0A9Q0TQ23_SALVM|nr:INTEGRATOR COMPLEX SUBUNIT 9 [Salix viminalis]